MRLNKAIADSGICSRREADRLIEAGEVFVNGRKVTAMGVQVDETDEIRVSGRSLPRAKKLYLLFHKPPGYITTRSDDRGRATIYNLLPEKFWSVDPAGRLDKESSGALILSNDGDFLNKITHPRYHVVKTYRIQVDMALSTKDIKKLAAGIELLPEGKKAVAEDIVHEAPTIVRLSLVTGYNRQIRRMFEALGFKVIALKRIAVGQIRLGNLAPGRSRPLKLTEIKQLLAKR